MNIDLGTSFTKLSATISRLFHRFGFIAIFLVVSAGIGISVFLLTDVLAKTDDPGDYTPETNTYNFDTVTIDKIKNLKDSDQATDRVDTSGVKRLLPLQ